MPTHFGVTVREGKRGLRLTREAYAIIRGTNLFYPKADHSRNRVSCMTIYVALIKNRELNRGQIPHEKIYR